MTEEITITDRSIIRNMMLSKSHKDIAILLGKAVPAIEACITELTHGTGIITYQQKLDEKRKARLAIHPIIIKKKKVKKLKELTPREIKREQATRSNEQIRKQQLQANKRRDPVYETKATDYAKQVMVRIDRTTCIYAKPGEEEKAKTDFLKKYSKPINRI